MRQEVGSSSRLWDLVGTCQESDVFPDRLHLCGAFELITHHQDDESFLTQEGEWYLFESSAWIWYAFTIPASSRCGDYLRPREESNFLSYRVECMWCAVMLGMFVVRVDSSYEGGVHWGFERRQDIVSFRKSPWKQIFSESLNWGYVHSYTMYYRLKDCQMHQNSNMWGQDDQVMMFLQNQVHVSTAVYVIGIMKLWCSFQVHVLLVACVINVTMLCCSFQIYALTVVCVQSDVPPVCVGQLSEDVLANRSRLYAYFIIDGLWAQCSSSLQSMLCRLLICTAHRGHICTLLKILRVFHHRGFWRQSLAPFSSCLIDGFFGGQLSRDVFVISDQLLMQSSVWKRDAGIRTLSTLEIKCRQNSKP